MTKQQIIDRIMKVKALADRGTDGERETAQRLLEDLMAKYGIKEEDINEEKREIYIIDAGERITTKLFSQLYRIKFGIDREIWNIETMTKKEKRNYSILGYGDKNANIAIECTKSEFIEVKALFEIYKTDLTEQLRIFMYAYFEKQDLLAPYNPDNNHKDDETDESFAFKAGLMSLAIEKKEIKKMIEGAVK